MITKMNVFLKKNEILKLDKIFKKNSIFIFIVILFLLIFTSILNLLISVELKSLWFNYNILFNSILERTRSYYIGLNDGLLQFHSCNVVSNPKVEKEMFNYIYELESIITSFPFSFCLNMFNLNLIFGFMNTLFYKKKKIYYFFKQSSNFSGVINDIDKCLNDILPHTLAQESIFLKQPIIDSKKQLWSIHQKMINYTNNIGDLTDNLTFGPESSICKNFLALDLEGGPTVTGVVLNNSYYQAPLFNVKSAAALTKMEISNHTIDMNQEYIREVNSLEDTKLKRNTLNKREMYPLSFDKIQLKEIKEKNKVSFINEGNNYNSYSHILSGRDSFIGMEMGHARNKSNNSYYSFSYSNINNYNDSHISNKKSNSFDEKMDKISIYTGMRTIYIPTSQILNNIKVFTIGMNEIQRNSKLKADVNIKKMKLFSFFILLTTTFFAVLIFVPLILVEREKRKVIFKTYGSIVKQRYKYYQNKYNKDLRYSTEIFNLVLFIYYNDICFIFSKNIEMLNPYFKHEIKHKTFFEIELICGQIDTILRYNIHSLWELTFLFVFLNSICNRNEFYGKKINLNYPHMNFDLLIKIMMMTLPQKYPTVNFKLSPRILPEKMVELDFIDIIQSYLIVTTLIFSLNIVNSETKNVFIEMKEMKLQIRISIDRSKSVILQRRDVNIIKLMNIIKNYISTIDLKEITDKRIEIEIIKNNLLEKLINSSSVLYTFYNDGNHIIAEIRGIQSIHNTNKNNEIDEVKIQKQEFLLIVLANKNNLQKTIKIVLSNMSEIIFDNIYEMLKFIFKANPGIYVILAEKSFLYCLNKEMHRMSRINKIKQTIYIYWFEFILGSDKVEYDNGGHILINNIQIIKENNTDCDSITFMKQINSFLMKSFYNYKIRAIIKDNPYKSVELKKSFNLPEKMIYEMLMRSYINDESKNNYLARCILFSEPISLSITNTFKIERSSNNYFRLYKRGVPLDILKRIYLFHLIPTYSCYIISNLEKNRNKVKFKTDIQNNKDIIINHNEIYLPQIDIKSIDEVTNKIACIISDIFKLICPNNFEYKTIESLMELWNFILSTYGNDSNNHLPFFSPYLVLHCNIVLRTFIKNSTPFIKDILLRKDIIVVFIICFMISPLCRPGISSEVLTFINSPLSLYANEIATIENDICKSFINILELPRFSNLFDSFEVSE
ncbi:hypothetical protein FG386_002514 [Cryptosporidium ryanae]|uniref:uncharacterized protein n=1 Tax=Cryptosporidium ryanae TaxID=515981 RepID=UPI003519F946|nr:hypothetical protein FG386_002514 [Cryptosporidium ryanae]